MERFVVTIVALTLSLPAWAKDRKPPPPPPVVVPAPPAQISDLDMARLDAANAHVKLITDKAERDLLPYVDTINKILTAYKITPTQIQSGEVKVDEKTGKITRLPPMTPSTPGPPPLPVKPPAMKADDTKVHLPVKPPATSANAPNK